MPILRTQCRISSYGSASTITMLLILAHPSQTGRLGRREPIFRKSSSSVRRIFAPIRKMFFSSKPRYSSCSSACARVVQTARLVPLDSPNPAIVAAVVEALVVLAHGNFLHPDAAVLADFLHHGQSVYTKTTASPGEQHPQAAGGGGRGGAASKPPSFSTTTADFQGSTASWDSSSLSSAESSPFAEGFPGGGGDPNSGGRGRGEGGERAEARSGAGSGAGSAGGTATLFEPTNRRGVKGMCMVRGRRERQRTSRIGVRPNREPSQPWLALQWYRVHVLRGNARESKLSTGTI